VATQQFPLSRLKAVAKAADCTLNDVVLALCGGTLRRFLMDEDELPEESLTAGVPVSFRPADDEGSGNAITFAIATLGTDIEDPAARLAAVVASTRAAKAHLASLPREAITQYPVLLMAPSILSMLTPIGGRTRPMFNVTVSNVPGPSKPLYFRGARMEAVYPISLIAHGIGLNITCESYAGSLDFAFVGCRDTLPHLQNMARYAADALAELEAAHPPAAATTARPPRKAPARKVPARKPAARRPGRKAARS
jgi:WS/DGAT/MGAT family acyltransferase